MEDIAMTMLEIVFDIVEMAFECGIAEMFRSSEVTCTNCGRSYHDQRNRCTYCGFAREPDRAKRS